MLKTCPIQIWQSISWPMGGIQPPSPQYDKAQTYLQPDYGNGVFGNVYLSAGQHLEINIAGTPLP